MNFTFKIVLAATATSALALAALAQESGPSNAPDNTILYQRMVRQRVELLAGVARVTDLIGMPVENENHEKLGRVHDVLLNLETGRIREVILASDNIPGLGRALTGVPPQCLHPEDHLKLLQLDASQEKFRAAPRFDPAPGDEITQSNRVEAVYVYFGEQSYFVANPAGLWTINPDGTPNRDGLRDANPERNAAIARHAGDDSNTITTRDPDGKETGNYYSNQNRAINSWSRLGPVEPATRLLGMAVCNPRQEPLGHVKNLLVDLAAGRVAGVILVSGRFFWTGGQLSSAPAPAFHFNPSGNNLQLDATRALLARSPAFSVNEWPNFPLPGNAGGDYYPYKIQPYNNQGAPGGTNHSGQWTRDQDSRRLSALAQGASPADQDLQRHIREAILADPQFSANANSILIVTLDGQVTLRGPVNTGDEKAALGALAERIAAGGKVDNELEVQFTARN